MKSVSKINPAIMEIAKKIHLSKHHVPELWKVNVPLWL